jgi:hypothetical protein
MDRLRDHLSGGAAAAGAVDPGPDEGALEAPGRRESGVAGVLSQAESDQAGAPGRVPLLELTGEGQESAGEGGDRAPAGAIVRGRSPALLAAAEPADIPDGAVGDRQVGRDPCQGDALLPTKEDLLTERDRERARHGCRLRASE